MLSINSSEYVFRRYETLKSWNFLTWCLQGKMTISKNDAPQNSRYDPATSHTFLSLHIETFRLLIFEHNNDNWIQLILITRTETVYTFCIQKLYEMYTTDVYRMYTKCIPHSDKLRILYTKLKELWQLSFVCKMCTKVCWNVGYVLYKNILYTFCIQHRACSSSLLHVIIAHNRLPFF